MAEKTTLSVYFAGGLFDHKELVGNQLLAAAVERESQGRFRMVLPQNFENSTEDALTVRNQDLKLLLSCDLILANFDGLELDSGTVAEFCTAKFLDMPSLLLRTDFRGGGERVTAPDPWNLMCSGWARSETLCCNAMEELIAADRDVAVFYARIAQKILAALERLAALPSILTKAELPERFRSHLRLLGSGMECWFTEPEIRQCLQQKVRSGLYR